jgi:hypothetical protein
VICRHTGRRPVYTTHRFPAPVLKKIGPLLVKSSFIKDCVFLRIRRPSFDLVDPLALAITPLVATVLNYDGETDQLLNITLFARLQYTII